MRISFDMDGTLVGCDPILLNKRGLPWLLRPWFEPLRQGSVSLMRELAQRGCEVWIYTSSDRSPLYLRVWFWLLGVAIGGIVNQAVHNRVVRDRYRFSSRTPSKYAPAFGIRLHVDDSEGVAQEGAAHGFDVLVISPSDPAWATRILQALPERVQSSKFKVVDKPPVNDAAWVVSRGWWVVGVCPLQ